MYTQFEEYLSNLDGAEEVTLDLFPVELVAMFESYYSPKIGRLMLIFRGKGLKFNFSIQPAEDYIQAFELFKSSKTLEEKIIYALLLMGLFNKVTRRGVDRFIETLTDKGD